MNHNQRHKNFEASKNSFLGFIFFALSFFILFGQGSLLFAQPSYIQHEKDLVVSQDLDHDFNFPLFLTAEIGEKEASASQDADGEGDSFSALIFSVDSFLIRKKSKHSAENTRFLHLSDELHNRTTVSLFILHHSWKSYLS